ncbi:MAG: hypothetical protein HY321_10495 [Armatimonadetes bacterium]|nr:hypothetical protein [Armatimonadota bacterium]
MSWLEEHFLRSRNADSARRALDAYRLGIKAGGALRGVQVMTAPDACPACRALAGAVYPIDEAPAVPVPECTHPAGCRCAYRPAMTYEEGE